MQTPSSIVSDEPKYKSDAWKQYSIAELGQWVHLFCKRATHRSELTKRLKDLSDAQSYLDMMQAHIDSLKSE